MGPLFGDGSPGGIVGSVPGPAAPPTVDAATIDLLSDPTDPQPGSVATLTVTVSGRNGSDRYGVAAAPVDLVLVTQPGTDAALSATSVTTDASGAATVKLTLSKTRGRHVVDATSGTISAEYVADTLAGAGLASRARHGGTITATPQAPRTNPVPFFAAAAIALVVGFASPYVRRRSLGGWLGPMKPAPARPTPGEPASAIAALRKPASAIAAPAKPASKAGSAKLVARPGTRRAGRLRASSKRTN